MFLSLIPYHKRVAHYFLTCLSTSRDGYVPSTQKSLRVIIHRHSHVANPALHPLCGMDNFVHSYNIRGNFVQKKAVTFSPSLSLSSIKPPPSHTTTTVVGLHRPPFLTTTVSLLYRPPYLTIESIGEKYNL